MAENIEELVVAARPENLETTASQFEDMQGSLEEAGGEMEETTGKFSDLSAEWTGLMGTLVSGIAVAAAGLLSQVPVVSETVSGLLSVVDALAFRMDSVLRPVLTPLGNGLYDLSEAIYDADGAMGAIIGVVSSLVAGLGLLATVIAGVGVAVPSLTAMGALTTVFSAVAGAVATVAGAIAGLISLPALLVAAVGVMVAALLTDFMGLRTKSVSILTGLWEDAKSIFGELVSTGKEKAKALWSGVTGWFDSIKEDAGSVFSGLIEDALDWGANLISNLVKGIKNAIPDLSGILNQDIVAGVSISDAISTVDGVVSSGGGGGSSEQSSGFSARRNTTANVYLDGRDVSDRTGRYRSDTTSRRGRHG